MDMTMVQQAPVWPLRRRRDGPRPAEDHLHFDRDARAWRSHGELSGGVELLTAAERRADGLLRECA